jgi:hypothetical protein
LVDHQQLVLETIAGQIAAYGFQQVRAGRNERQGIVHVRAPFSIPCNSFNPVLPVPERRPETGDASHVHCGRHGG